MPQINQISEIFISQLFWLLLVFGMIYFVIGRGMVPKIRGVVEQRDAKITSDLDEAQRARDEAEKTESAYRERMNASRAEAMKLAQAAKQAAARDAEERTRAVDSQVGGRIAEAEARIRASVETAMRDLDSVAAEAAGELVAKLTGQGVPADEARQAVKAVLHG
ncbi:MAG: ATPase [Sphingomonas sp.]|nr:ATPase [Sphingomonas sp.]